jgi:DNA (cytosine-5)-methyltransferase 1
MVQHVCEKCEKIFKQKSQLDAHNNRKTPCKKDGTIEKIVEKKVQEVLTRLNVVVPTITDSSPISLNFIDLFCGIGGFHEALKRVIPSASCVMSSDIDQNARTSYEKNHGLVPRGDIKTIDLETIRSFDLLCGGFPCQAFSIAQWKDKKAFDDPRGTLFFEILRIIDHHHPRCILLENVSNLVKINKGEVLKTILNSLTTRGYKVSFQLLSPHQFGIPQNRERVYIVASTTSTFSFSMLGTRASSCKLQDILDTNVPEDHWLDPSVYTLLEDKDIKRQPKSGLKFCGYLNGTLRQKGARENTEHLSRVHKQLMRIYSTDGTHPTLAASETSGRYHIYDEHTQRVRRLTLNECYKLMDYPTTFQKHSSKGVAYKQIGNSVCVKVVEEIMREMVAQRIL